MGGVIDGGVGIGAKSSPRRAAIEKAQAELRLKYDSREERRRELEFLEKGGDPLDFKFALASSLSVQSTSHTDQHPDHFLTSEAKGSFALTASPHGDSVESIGRLGVTVACEPNSADNFDGENRLLESERKSKHLGRGCVFQSQHSSQLDGNLKADKSEDSPIFHPKKGQAYRRRNRSRISRDGPRSSSTDMGSHGGHCSLSGRRGMLSKSIEVENQIEMESLGIRFVNSSTTIGVAELPKGKLEVSTIKGKLEELHSQVVKDEETPLATTTGIADLVTEMESKFYVDVERPCSSTEKPVDHATDAQLNESSKINGVAKCIQTEGVNNNVEQAIQSVVSESSCTQTSLGVGGNGNIDSDLCTNLKNVDNNGATKEHKLSLGEKLLNHEKLLYDKHDTSAQIDSFIKEDQNSMGHEDNGFVGKDKKEIGKGRPSSIDQPKSPTIVEELEANYHTETKSDIQAGLIEDSVPEIGKSRSTVSPSSADPFCTELSKTELSTPPPLSEPKYCAVEQLKINKEREDRVLEEAQIIKAKRKRIAELSTGLFPIEHRQKSSWDFVIEEMVWLANDFAQERFWKMTASAQFGYHVAFASRSRSEEKRKHLKQRTVAHTMEKAVMDFWHSARLVAKNGDNSQSGKRLHDASSKTNDMEVVDCESGGSDKDKPLSKDLRSGGQKRDLAINGYAVRFLQFNCLSTPPRGSSISQTSDLATDIDLPEVLWQDQFTEENLFYVVPPGAMETYRRSIESCLEESQRTGHSMQEQVDTSTYDPATELRYQENNYEDEGENASYYMHGGFHTGKASKKKRKNMKSYAARSYESYGHCMENKNGTPQSILMGKRPVNSLHVGPIPTKRMRTASRQRVVLPFNAGSSGFPPAPSRADASSGDTNSFQDDHSTLHGRSIARRGSEVNSAMDFENNATFDSTEISTKPKKKKKKIKHQVAAYDPRWQLDSTTQSEQKDHIRRMESHQLESNGNCGFFGHHAKKIKIMKQSSDNSLDNTMAMSGSVALPVASQMSNMPNQSKIIKLIGGRDRGRKAKALKVSSGQSGSGNPWSLFEDQALVVLVHDMGPNWELVSDAINSTLQFKCIFHKPGECKVRHKILMDRTSGDGADSAEDSGSSQPYPSTLPGIPKGSARQLFQRLQGPMEEDTIKSHFEKIIVIGQQLHYQKEQNDNRDQKQIAPVQSSHVVALSQVIPNNVNGDILTPLDLCDVPTPSEGVLPLAFQGPHAGGLASSNQDSIPTMHQSSGLNSPLQGLQDSPGMSTGNSLALPSSQFNSPRDARYAVPRSSSLPMEEQPRLQQYNHMLPGRNIQPSNLLSPGTLSGNRVLPGVNGVSVKAGMSRSMPIPRPGLNSPSMLNSGSILASNMGEMPSNMNMHRGPASAGQGSSMFRTRDALHMVRNPEKQRQMMLPEMQKQGTQPNSSVVRPFGALLPNQTASSSVQTFPGHHQQQHSHGLSTPHHPQFPGPNHSATPEQQDLIRIARDRKIRERLMQQQHQLPSSNALKHAQGAPLLPVSSSVLSNSQPVSLTSVTSSPLTHEPSQQHKHPVQPHGIGRSGQSETENSQLAKQRQKQLQQSGRQHPQQSQQAKILTGMGRTNNKVMHQNFPIDSSHLNGLSGNPGDPVTEKGQQSEQSEQGHGSYSGSGQNSKPMASPETFSSHSQPQKPYANSAPTTSKQVQQIPSHLENSNNGQNPKVPSALNQARSPSLIPISNANHQQLQEHPELPLKVVNQSDLGLQRSTQQVRQVSSSDSSSRSQADHAPGASPACVDSTYVTPISSSPSTSVQKLQESQCDSSMPSSSAPLGSISSTPLVDPSDSEPFPSVSQGLGQRQLSGSWMPHAHGMGAQWKQQQSQLQQAPPPLQPLKLSQRQLEEVSQPEIKKL